jgi:hypothetical protein
MRVRDVPGFKGRHRKTRGRKLFLLLCFQSESLFFESVKHFLNDLSIVRDLVHVIVDKSSEVFQAQELLYLAVKLTKMRIANRFLFLVGRLKFTI